MKLKVICTPLGLQPIYEEDYDSKKMLKVGECYTADIRLIRNLQFHKKAFSLLNTAWSLLPERTQNGFRTIDAFRDTITVAAGFPTTVTPAIQYGAVPVFVDVTIPQYNADITRLEAAISPKTGENGYAIWFIAIAVFCAACVFASKKKIA